MSDTVESAADRGPTTDHSVVPHQPQSRRERRALDAAAIPAVPAASVAATPVIPPAVIAAAAAAPTAARPVPARPALRTRVSALGTMVAVVAIFGVFALPAYALDAPDSTTTSADDPAVVAQGFDVDDDAVLTAGTRDAYAATSYAEYLEAQAALLRSSYGTPVAVAGDDYPFKGGSGLSALGYFMGQCTDFVAWRLNRDAGSTGAPWKYTWGMMTPWGGDAESWLSAWYQHGWPVSTTPIAGSVAWFNGNHVGYVKEVYADGSFMLEDYNRVGWETYAREIFQPGTVPYFLYPPG